MSKKLISLFLTLALFTSAVIVSYASAEGDVISDLITDEIKDKGVKATETVEEAINENGEAGELLDYGEWKQYIGDLETFAYGLIIRQLEYVYDVFPASVELSDGSFVYGIAYTSYSDCYTNDDQTLCYFEAGFLPFCGEMPVSQEDFDSGLLIKDLDYTDDKVVFVWVYGSDPFRQHCVVYNQYMQYGVDDSGAIFFESVEYMPGVCDESIGSLYSYDETRYLFDIDVGIYKGITGASLFSELDYTALEKEINRILQTQNLNFASVDVVSCAYFAQEAIVSYLLSLQEETFLGYSVPELVEAAASLDPLECYRITSNGIKTLKLEKGSKASDLTKWLVGSACVIVTAVSLVGAVVCFECPVLSALFGAAAGAAIDIFMQVVISEKDLDGVEWRKVALGAAAGALGGYLGPYLYAACGGSTLACFAVDSLIDGLIDGVERAAEAWMDGSDAEGIAKSFGFGFALGLVLSAGFKGLAAGVSKIASKLSPALTKFAEKLPEKLTGKVSAFTRKIGDAIGKLKKAADSSLFHNEHLAKKIASTRAERLIRKNVDELVDKSMRTLSVDGIVDANGEKITKATLKELAVKAKKGSTIGYFKKGDELISIVKDNNVVGIVFDSAKYTTIDIPGGLTDNRMTNYTNFAKELKKQWLKNPSMIPDSLDQAIKNTGIDLEDLLPQDIVSIIQKSDWVIHENINMISASLVPRVIHEEIKHMGGVALVKYVKSHMAISYFDQLVYAASTSGLVTVH